MKKISFTILLTFTAAAAFAQNASQVQKLFEAGQYQRVVESAQPDGDPAVLYTAAQSHQKLGENDRAVETYGALAARDEGDVWHFIGLSGQQLVQDDVEGALASARQAVAMNDGMAEAHYQLGLVHAKRQEWPQAAAGIEGHAVPLCLQRLGDGDLGIEVSRQGPVSKQKSRHYRAPITGRPGRTPAVTWRSSRPK